MKYFICKVQDGVALGELALLGFGQMCTLFLTGSSSGLLVHSLLPLESQARFGWVGWFAAAAAIRLGLRARRVPLACRAPHGGPSARLSALYVAVC